jgi:hypothetical protein
MCPSRVARIGGESSKKEFGFQTARFLKGLVSRETDIPATVEELMIKGSISTARDRLTRKPSSVAKISRISTKNEKSFDAARMK